MAQHGKASRKSTMSQINKAVRMRDIQTPNPGPHKLQTLKPGPLKLQTSSKQRFLVNAGADFADPTETKDVVVDTTKGVSRNQVSLYGAPITGTTLADVFSLHLQKNDAE